MEGAWWVWPGDRAAPPTVRPSIGFTDTDYGSHQFDLRDRDGNVWSMGTYRGA